MVDWRATLGLEVEDEGGGEEEEEGEEEEKAEDEERRGRKDINEGRDKYSDTDHMQ